MWPRVYHSNLELASTFIGLTGAVQLKSVIHIQFNGQCQIFVIILGSVKPTRFFSGKFRGSSGKPREGSAPAPRRQKITMKHQLAAFLEHV